MRLIVAGEDRSHLLGDLDILPHSRALGTIRRLRRPGGELNVERPLVADQRHVSTALAVCRLKASD